MDSKFVIFVVFATLARSSLAQQSQVYGLSTEETAVFNEILNNQEATIAAKFDAFNPVFDILERLSAIFIYGLTAETDDTSSTVVKALNRAKDAIDHSVDSILLLQENPCSDAEAARNSTHADLDHVYALVPMAIQLAVSGNYDENRAKIEELRVAGSQDLANLVVSIYNSFRTCLHITDSDTLAAIQISQDGSGQGLIYTLNSVFNAILDYAFAVSTEKKDVALISAIEDSRSYTLSGLRADVEHKFSLIKALFINSKLNRNGIVSDLYSIQYATTVSTYRHNADTETIFETIIRYLSGVARGRSDAGNNDFSLTDAARDKTAAKFKAALRVLTDSVLDVAPDASTLAATIWEYFVTLAELMSGTYYDSIVSTQTQNITYCDAVKNIETVRDQITADIPQFVDKILELIRNGKSWEDDVEVEITTLRRDAITAVEICRDAVVDAIKVLLKASYGIGTISEVDFSAIRNSESEALSGIAAFTYEISAIRVITLSAVEQSMQKPRVQAQRKLGGNFAKPRARHDNQQQFRG